MRRSLLAFLTAAALLAAACGEPPADDALPAALGWNTPQDTTTRLASATGFSGPEAVRYDPDQDVYFVSNFNGETSGDANGFISRVTPDGDVETLRFMVGTDAYPMHAPRGMFIVGDTLWAADADGLHGFDRRNGDHLAFVDFTSFEPGFLNDIAQGPDGALYVTDTGNPRLYRLHGGEVTVAVDDTLLGRANGITWDGEQFVFAPWGGEQNFRTWRPGDAELSELGTSPGGNFDGIEPVGDRLLVASQQDSSLHVLEDGSGRAWLSLPGRPADIGVDTQRGRVAVPYVALDRVDFWALPAE